MSLLLRLRNGPKKGQEYTVHSNGTALLGTHPKSNLILPQDPQISGQHAVVEYRAPMARLIDHSANGTWVGQTRVQHRKWILFDGSTLRCGDTEIEVAVIKDEKESDIPGERAAFAAPWPPYPVVIPCPTCRTLLRPRVPDIPPLEFLELLGMGGAGEVFLVADPQRESMAAVKVYALSISDHRTTERDVQRFLRGLRAHADSGKSPNVVRYLRSGYAEGAAVFLITEFVDGPDLHSYMAARSRPLEWRDALNLGGQILSGLGEVHQQGISHRDLKPSNILLSPESGDWIAKITDFDVSHSFFEAGMQQHSQTQSAFYTEGFSPPEQISDFRSLDPRADVYAFGMTLHYLLLRDLPLGGKSDELDPPGLQAEFPIRISVADSLRDQGTPPWLVSILERCLERNPEDRYPDAKAVQEAIDEVHP